MRDKMNKRWQIIAEITCDILPEENAGQALDRVKKQLERLLEPETGLAHYHILQQPKECYEFD